MRPIRVLNGLRASSILAMALATGACSTSGSDSALQTQSLSQRPPYGVRPDAPPSYASNSGYTTGNDGRTYSDPGRSYSPPPQQQAYAAPASPYSPPPNRGYIPPPDYANGPYGRPTAQAAPQGYGAAAPIYPPQQPAYGQQQAYAQPPYAQQPYAQQPNAAYQPRPYAQGQAPYQPGYGAQPAYPPQGGYVPGPQASAAPTNPNLTTGSISKAHTSMIQVKEGDTLFGISRRTGVPITDLVAANKIQGGRIAVGQNLIIPQPRR